MNARQLVCMALAGCAPALTIGQTEFNTLGEVSVTAGGYLQQVDDAPASISVIGREQLEEHYYKDVTDALKDIPGVIVTGGGDRQDIVLRGMPASYTLILVDGRPVSTRETRPNGSSGFEQDWLPPLQNIERIEVVRGPMSTLYGSDAMGGVINIITRKVAEKWGGSLQLDTIIQDDSRSGDIQQGNFSISGPLKEGLLGLQLYGGFYDREEDYFVDGVGSKDLNNINAKLSFTPHANHDFTVEASTTKEDRQSLVGRTIATSGCRGGCEDVFQTYDREAIALTHTGRWQLGTSNAYYQRERAENESREMIIVNENAKGSMVLPLADHMLTVGLDFISESLSDETTNQISDRTETDVSRWAFFLEDEWMMTDTFSVTAGARLDDDENYGSHISPRLYGVWGFSPRWTLKGGVSTGFRAPSLRDITADWGRVSRGGNIYGNPDLKPETSFNQELGLYYNAGRVLQANVTVFHNDFEDKITRVSCPITICTDGQNQFGADPTYQVNVDEAETEGVEVAISSTLAKVLSLNLSYTFTESEQKSGEYKGEPLTQLPRHLASLRLDWQATASVKPWVTVRYRGEESQPTTGPSSSSIIAPANTLVDTGIGFRLTPNSTLNTGVYNLTDKEIFSDEYGYVDDGRRYWLGVQASF